jgi:D-tyrosyl-tRNA(Tyr) deacylase
MIGLIQRVSESEIWVGDKRISSIEKGILLLVGVAEEDEPEDITYIADKTVNLRIFGDEKGHLNRSLLDVMGEILVVSQFTLLGDTRKGRRPSFTRAADPQKAEHLYRLLIKELKKYNIVVKEGKFREMMEVKLSNSGPVTLIIDSKINKQRAT